MAEDRTEEERKRIDALSDSLDDAELEMAKSLDRWILAIASGGVWLSLKLLESAKEPLSEGVAGCVSGSWIAGGIAICMGLLALYSSQAAHSKAQEFLSKGLLKQWNYWATSAKCFNAAALLTTIAMVVFLVASAVASSAARTEEVQEAAPSVTDAVGTFHEAKAIIKGVANFLIDFLRVTLVWPPVALLLGYHISNRFKEPIASLLSRITEGQALGSSFKAPSPVQQQSPPPHGAPEVEGENPDEITGEDIEVNTELREQLNFEQAFNAIYGSQVRMLEELERKKNSGCIISEITCFYDQYRASYMESRPKAPPTSTITAYLDFLRSYGLVQDHTEAPMISIAPSGEKFLEYIRRCHAATYATRPL